MAKHKIYYKRVLLPIVVPYGDYCWGGKERRICEHFDNEGGCPMCTLYMGMLDYDEDGNIPKPERCKGLKEV